MATDLSHLVSGLAPFPESTGPGTYRPPVNATAPGSDSVNDYAMVQAQNVPAPDAGTREDYAHLLGESGAREARPAQSSADRPGSSYAGWTVV